MRPLFRLVHIVFVLTATRLFRPKHLWFAQACELLGPSFIKLGQTLSTRPDLVGEKVALALGNLRDDVKPFPSDIAQRIVRQELGDVFASFEAVPVAAASIAQVHRAQTKAGQWVAVKILRPNIEKRFARDIALFSWIARRLERNVSKAKRLKPVEVVELFKQTVAMELDLRFEAAAAAEFAENIKNDEGFRVPAVDWALTTQRLLVMEWVEGTKLSDLEGLRAKGIDFDAVLQRLSEAFFTHAFRDGFFHADLHPGNLFVDDAGQIVAVDFGIMGRLSESTRLYMAQIFLGFLNKDFKKVAKAHFDAGYVPAHHDVDQFAMACRAIAMPILDKPMNEISVGALLGQLFYVTETFDMETQPQLLLFQKTLVVVEGIGRMLNQNINMWELARGPMEQWAREHFGLKGRVNLARKLVAETLETLPILAHKLKAYVDALQVPAKPL